MQTKFKFWYVTRVAILGVQGQSVQVQAMAEAFSQLAKHQASEKKNIEFKLISTSHCLAESKSKSAQPLKKKVKPVSQSIYSPSFDWRCLYKIKSGKRRNFFKQLWFLWSVFFILSFGRPQIVYTRDILVAFVCWFLRLKCAYEIHNRPQNIINRSLLKFLKKKRCLQFITISQVLKDYYQYKYRVPQEKILAHHDGVFIEKYDAIRKLSKKKLRSTLKDLPMKKIHNKAIVMYTGSLSVGKGGKYLKQIAALLLKEAVVVHVGPMLDYAPHAPLDKTKQSANKKPLSKEESWKLYFKENPNLYMLSAKDREAIIYYQMAADVLIFPTEKILSTSWCNSPLKLFEYMASGNLIVANKISPAVLEVLNDNHAVLVDFAHEEALREAIKFAIEPTRLRQEMSENALELVRENYTWQKRAQSIYNFLIV